MGLFHFGKKKEEEKKAPACACSCDCTTEFQSGLDKNLRIEYLYLDRDTCERCIGTNEVLQEVVDTLRPALAMAGYEVDYRECEMKTAQIAEQYRFLSSPTIRVNGRDIFGEIQESDCGCCSEIAGTHVDCRVFTYEGKTYEVPTKELLASALLKSVFAESACCCADRTYVMPENLKRFYEGKNRLEKCSSACSCGCADDEGKEHTSPCCSEAENGICCIKVLGAGCKSCHEQVEQVRKAVTAMGLPAEVEYITDMQEVMEYGVMSMPAIVVNERVVSMGKVLKAADVKKLLREMGF